MLLRRLQGLVLLLVGLVGFGFLVDSYEEISETRARVLAGIDGFGGQLLSAAEVVSMPLLLVLYLAAVLILSVSYFMADEDKEKKG